MRLRPLGRTGLVVSELALGTWGLSGDAYGPVAPSEARRVVERALEIGFTLFDTADAYGAGKMEALLGDVLGASRDGVVLATKIGTDRTTEPPTKRFDPPYLRASVERSLKRTGRARLDVVLLHNPSKKALAAGEAAKTMDALVAEGKVGAWGASTSSAEASRAAIDAGAKVLSLAYHLFRPIDLHRVSGDVMVMGVGVLAHSILSHGLLAGEWRADRRFEEHDHRVTRWTQAELRGRIEQLDALRFLVKGDVRSLLSAAVRYPLSSHLVSSAVLGPRSVEQLEALVRDAGGGPVYLTDDALTALPRALAKVGIPT